MQTSIVQPFDPAGDARANNYIEGGLQVMVLMSKAQAAAVGLDLEAMKNEQPGHMTHVGMMLLDQLHAALGKDLTKHLL